MNWKKLIKYSIIGLMSIILIGTIILYFGMKSSIKQFYGANTPHVDHTQFEPLEGSVAIKNVSVLSPSGENFISGQTVTIENGSIKTIDSIESISTQFTVIDGSGKFLIPGLIDSHVHLLFSPNDFLLYIANGVTEIREMIGNKERLNWKKEIEEGRIGPKMWVASPPLGTADNMQNRFISWTREAKNVSDAEEASKAIEEFVEDGYDVVKIYSHLNKESYIAANKRAQELQIPVVGHIPWEVSLDDFWNSGQTEVAHLEEIMNALRRAYGNYNGKEADFLAYIKDESSAMAKNLNARNIVVTSTLSFMENMYRQKFELENLLGEVALSYANVGVVEGVGFGDKGFGWLPKTNLYKLPQGLNEEQMAGEKMFWSTYVKACQILATELSNNGVTILAGTDANIPATVPGFSLHDELESLQQSGMSNTEVLQAATSIPANFMNSKTGKVAIGLDANLILLDNNPLEDIGNTRTINTVFCNGKVYDRNLLDQMLAAVKETNDGIRKVDISEYLN